MIENLFRLNLLWTVVLISTVLFLPLTLTYAASTSISATVKITVCGDGIVETPEQCDGSNLNDASCATRGFTEGSLSCAPACEFDISSCTSNSSGGGSGGGGRGGRSGVVSAPSTSVVFSGKAYPGSIVTLLKDAQIAATTVAGANASFQINLSGLSGGNYIFSVYSEDKQGVRSSLLTFPVSVTSGTTANITGIFIAPTIVVDKNEVRHGDTIVFFGQAAPFSEVTLSINSEEEFFIKKITDVTGAYLLNFDTSVLEIGQHLAKSKAALNGEITAFSKVVGFNVGTKNVFAELPAVTAKGDTNGDSQINLIDFSVAAYWYKRSNPPASADLSGDGKVDLVDFSIMAFNWTG